MGASIKNIYQNKHWDLRDDGYLIFIIHGINVRIQFYGIDKRAKLYFLMNSLWSSDAVTP